MAKDLTPELEVAAAELVITTLSVFSDTLTAEGCYDASGKQLPQLILGAPNWHGKFLITVERLPDPTRGDPDGPTN